MAGLISLQEEKKLADKVKKYPVLYDRLVEGYNEKDVASVAWEEVAQELEFIENGAKAQSLYITLKKKYQRKKRDLAEATTSGIQKAITRAERSLHPYEFMTWLDTYFVPRQKRKLDYGPRDQDSVDTFDYEYSMVIPKQSSVLGRGESCKDTSLSSNFHGETSNYGGSKFPNKTEMSTETSELSVRDSLMQHSKVSSDEPRKRKCEKEDREGLFCKSLAADLRDLPHYERCMAKNEITNVIFKYQMKILTKHREHGSTNQSSL